MNSPSSIVISGDLGGGKTTVSSIIAKALGLRRISIGQLYRDMAQRQGLSAVQMNLHSERDEAIDNSIDQVQRDLARTGEPLIVDSRLAWHFFPNALKVHLIVDPVVAAQRVILRPQSEVEAYSSIEEAAGRLRERNNSERTRFLKKYGVDKAKLRNYDLVCDTTHASPESIAERIMAAFLTAQNENKNRSGNKPTLLLFLDPLRMYPSEDIKNLRDLWSHSGEQTRVLDEQTIAPITVAYTGQHFYVVDGHRRLSLALQNGISLISAELLAEDNEHVALGLTAQEYFENEVQLKTLYDWEATHNIQLQIPPHLLTSIRN